MEVNIVNNTINSNVSYISNEIDVSITKPYIELKNKSEPETESETKSEPEIESETESEPESEPEINNIYQTDDIAILNEYCNVLKLMQLKMKKKNRIKY